ncbi:hypothetical protein ACN38_g4551 [Penicillium nordicum]|uniref:Uncharacterized protein n=1 Tax=Penicillium nordicum TaxID=229535 RepID=A0A0M8PAB6_9EURO|nr:hypothetical protein ACN38_g4551 [Penicillium nordicum]
MYVCNFPFFLIDRTRGDSVHSWNASLPQVPSRGSFLVLFLGRRPSRSATLRPGVPIFICLLSQFLLAVDRSIGNLSSCTYLLAHSKLQNTAPSLIRALLIRKHHWYPFPSSLRL